MDETSMEELLRSGRWQAIPGCPGRYVLIDPRPTATPHEVGGAAFDGLPVLHLESARCRDAIEVLLLSTGGGLLSYRRADGTYCHTLNTAEGLERKLTQLGLRSLASGQHGVHGIADPG